jgi:hypothetical protein
MGRVKNVQFPESYVNFRCDSGKAKLGKGLSRLPVEAAFFIAPNGLTIAAIQFG